ncbi:hypothetical protein M3221_23305 [Domibacillus indicus]|uniref:hypothetical protein n=1 Tax=Domibacillus indicus TaxID=1437523 RepID=UPI00203BC585|nr:hypothetical protein [Domibacillus indicus]MCM3791265.1 hypothetical protein [Domibacillus indicus]
MFQQLDSHIKQWIVNSVMGVAIALLVLGFFTGEKQDGQPPPAETEVNRQQENKEAISHDSKAEPETIEQYYADDYGDMGEIPPTPVNESEQPPPLEEFFSKEEIAESKAVAEKFITDFYPYDGKDPLQNIRNSKSTVSRDLYELLMESPERPTSMTVERELVSLETIEPFAPAAEVMTWNAKVNGVVTDAEGVKRAETDLYKLKLEKVEGEYKVVDFLVNYLE